MFNLFNILSVYCSKDTKIVNTKVSKDTVKTASIPNALNPAYEDVVKHKLLPSMTLTVFSNPNIGSAEIPPELQSLFTSQSLQAAHQKTTYPMLLPELVGKFPGYSEKPDDILITESKCDLDQTESCPPGYQKVSLKNYRQRTLDELKKLVGLEEKNDKPEASKKEKSSDSKKDDSEDSENSEETESSEVVINENK